MKNSISHCFPLSSKNNGSPLFVLKVIALLILLPGLLLAQPSALTLQLRQTNSINKTGTSAQFPNTLAVQQADASSNPLLQIIQSLVGPGITVSNIQTTLPATSNIYGSFTGGLSVIGMDAGLLMTSGSVFNAIGPNISPSTSQDNGLPGYLTIDTLGFDAAVISFDVVSNSASLSFKYVFASEEYNEYVGSVFNDDFAFLITGPGFPTPTNIALIPGTNHRVDINDINLGLNPQYYVDNESTSVADPNIFQNLEYDGLTKVLNTAAITVVPGATYTITLVVQDVSDHVYDSGVFIQGGSITSDTCLLSLFTEKHNISCNGLTDGSIDLSVFGATNPVQYIWSNGSTNQDLNNLIAGSYQVTITDARGCSKSLVSPVVIHDPALISTGQPIITGTSCGGGGATGSVQLVATGGTPPYLYTVGSSTNNSGFFDGLNAGPYTYSITDNNNCSAASSSFNIPGGTASGLTCCIGVNPYKLVEGQAGRTIFIGYGPQCVTLKGNAFKGVKPFLFNWSTASTDRNIEVCPTTTTTYTLTVTDQNGCTSTCTETINVIDVRCGNGLQKVQLCHKPNSTNTTMCVIASNVAAHLAHGDKLGACNSSKELMVNESTMDNSLLQLSVVPNPSTGSFSIQIGTENTTDNISLRIIDLSGRQIELRENLTPGQIVLLGENYDLGIYMAQLIQGNQTVTTKLVKYGVK